MWKSVAVLERDTPAQIRTILEPASFVIVSEVLSGSIVASLDTLIPKLLGVNIIEFTIRLPVMEILSTEQRFLKFRVLSPPAATIG